MGSNTNGIAKCAVGSITVNTVLETGKMQTEKSKEVQDEEKRC